jgi:hypothetical protein
VSSDTFPALSHDESSRLSTLEATIERGLTTFVEVGSALSEIRDQRLYRETHGTFESYCQERWGMSSRRANQLVSAAEVVSAISDNGNHGSQILPTTERQARPLAELPKPDRADAWQEAVESAPNGKPTAKTVKDVVDRKLGREPKPDPPKTARVNGVEAPDPPDVAKLRANGKIPADVIVEVEEPEPEVIEPIDAPELESEGEVHPDDLSDDAWLDTMPQRPRLAGRNLQIFDEQAIAFRRLEKARRSYAHHANHVLKPIRRRGPFTGRVRSFLKIEHPRHWPICPSADKGGCGGTGEVPMLGECPQCRGAGFWIK